MREPACDSAVGIMLRGALRLASWGRLSILFFHRVLAERDPLLPGEPSAKEFDALLAHVAQRFMLVPLEEGIRRTFEQTLPPRALAITFDDGYADNLSIAAPLLRRRGIPATVFVATGFLDGGTMWNDRVIAAFRSTARSELDLGALGLGKHSLGSEETRRRAIERVLRAMRHRPHFQREADARRIVDIARG